MIFHDKKSTSTLKTSLSLLFACRLGREIKAGVSLYGDKTDLFNFLNWYQVVGDNYNMTHGIIASLNFFFVCCGKWVRKTETRVNLRPEEEQITDLDQGNCISCRCSIVLWAKGGRIVRFQYCIMNNEYSLIEVLLQYILEDLALNTKDHKGKYKKKKEKSSFYWR